ncbi:MAG TPA: hypothetical protein VI603_04890 [Saprospiraceae bacterium]|nr:hypothetical protein [Saprospiraceae bacterium]
MKIKILVTFFFLVLLCSLSAQNRILKATPVAVESGIAVSDSGVQRLIVWLDDLDAQLKAEAPHKGMAAQTANLNLSKSNINKTKGNVKDVSAALDKLKRSMPAKHSAALAALQKALADLESPITELYHSLLNLGERYASKAAELKTRHDTVKNSIGNIR